jgi:putative nucleotidyltransferase with HDIG domain
MDLLDRLVGNARDWEPQPMGGRERTLAAVAALAFLVAAGTASFLLEPDGRADPLLAAGLVVLYAALWRVRFEVGTIMAHAEQLVFVPMLFLVPIELVPLLAVAGNLLGRVPDFIRRETHPDRWIYAIVDAWPVLVPVAVIGALAPGPPMVEHLDVYALALVAEMAIGGTALALFDRLVYGMPVAEMLRQEAWNHRIDLALSPIAFVIAFVAAEEPLSVLSVAPLAWLLSVFSQERKERYAAALELNQAYRGTVMVLADVVEADDNYTANHCRSVVELAVAVAEELNFDSESRQELEIAALLHDVGKIAVPKEILNKPAALTDAEFEIMKSHTVEGQALLDRVGGLLARVGEIVRSCHERWDGAGYPDGLRGEEIPLASRVVFCCDAFSAMTTDRPYRKALSEETALEEIRRNAGTQFDPRVSQAVCKVVRSGQASANESYTDAVRAVLAGHSMPAAELQASA